MSTPVSYTLTISLAQYNSAQTDPNKEYRGTYYDTVTVVFTSVGQNVVRNDSSEVAGLVGKVKLSISYLNTTLSGQVVDQYMQPVQNALVTLYDETVVPGVEYKQATTAADGSYQFTGIDNGLSIELKAVSQDGSLQGTLGPLTLPASVNPIVDSLRSNVTAEQLMVTPAATVSPFVTGITPEDNSDVAPNTPIVYSFSEPIRQTAYTQTGLPVGDSTMIDNIVLTFNGMKKTDGAVNFTVQWNSTFSQLTITPQGLSGSARYSLDMRTVLGKLTDAALHKLVNNPNIVGDFEVFNFTTVGTTPMPGVPVVTREFVPGSYNDLDYTGGWVELQWGYDANARSYNVYKSVDGSPYQLDSENVYAIQFAQNTGSLVVPLNSLNPLSAGSVSYEVSAVSKDLVETAPSNAITITDQVDPKLLNAAIAPVVGDTNTYTYTLYFSEPLTISTAENIGNYVFSGTGGVTITKTAAHYLGNDVGTTYTMVEISVTTSAPLGTGYTLTVTGVTDLAGNGMDQKADTFTF